MEFEQSYRDYIRELGKVERYPFPLDYDFDDFPALIERLSNLSLAIDLPDGFVPNTTYWLIERGEIVGVSNLRHEMTEALKLRGGHIGFGVRPSAQNRGVGKDLLRQTLRKAREIGIVEVYLVCLKSNAASSKVIVTNGGELEAEYAIPEYAEVVQRYMVKNDDSAA